MTVTCRAVASVNSKAAGGPAYRGRGLMSGLSLRRERRLLALQFLRCGAAKSDTLAGIADMPPARRGLRYAGLCPISAINLAAEATEIPQCSILSAPQARGPSPFRCITALPSACNGAARVADGSGEFLRPPWQGHLIRLDDAFRYFLMRDFAIGQD